MSGGLTVLVTGGGGYVGSHTVVQLLNNNYSVIVIDNLVNCYAEKNQKPESLKRVEQITKKAITFYSADIRDRAALEKIFKAVSTIEKMEVFFLQNINYVGLLGIFICTYSNFFHF